MKTYSILSVLVTVVTITSCSSVKKVEADKPLIVDSIKPASYYTQDDHEMCSEPHEFKKKVWPKKEVAKAWAGPSRVVASEESLLKLAGSAQCKDITALEIKEVIETIDRLGGKAVDPMDYSDNVEGLRKFMDDVGVSSYFDANEMVTPNNASVAKRCGNEDLLPPRCRWLSGAVQGMIATKIHGFINKDSKGNDIILRNWWRPACYNKGVEGAGTSDHIQARGFDLDFETSKQRATAQNFICQMYKEKNFNLQVGIGCNTLHVGVGSPKRLGNFPKNGTRFWTYGSLNGCEVKRLSTDDCFVMDSNGKKHIHLEGLDAKDGAL